MKKHVLALLLATVVLVLSACSNTQNSNIIAETNAGNISVDELYAELKVKYGEQVEESLQSIILTKVLSESFKVSDEEVNEVIYADKEKLGDQFEQVLQQSQFNTEGSYKKAVKLNLLLEKAALEDVEINDEELKEYYKKLKTDIRVSHILVEDEETAHEVKTKLDNGGAFDSLADKYSIDEPTAFDGGDIGWVEPGTTDREFEEAAYKLNINEFGGPVRTEHGWHIIQLTGKKEKESFDHMKEELEKSYKLELAKPNEILSKVLKAANIKVKDEDLEKSFEAFVTDLLNKDPVEDKDAIK